MVGTLSDETIEQTVDNEIRAQYAGMEEEAAKNSLLPAILWRNSGDTAKILRVKNKSMCTRSPRKPKIFDSFCHAHAFVLSDDTLRFMPGGTGVPEIQPVFYKHSRIFAVQLV